MRKDTNLLCHTAVFLAGVAAAGLILARRKPRQAARRLVELETQVKEQAAKLAETPTTEQIVGAVEQLLAKTMSSLDDRLTTQAQSIEVLKATVAQTDSLLGRVLESLDSLQTYAEPELKDEALRPAV